MCLSQTLGSELHKRTERPECTDEMFYGEKLQFVVQIEFCILFLAKGSVQFFSRRSSRNLVTGAQTTKHSVTSDLGAAK